MRKVIEYVLLLLAAICLVLAMIGRIHGYNNREENTPLKEDYSSFEETGTKFETYTTDIQNSLLVDGRVEVNKTVKGFGNVIINYANEGGLTKTTLKLDDNSLFTKMSEVVESLISFKDYLVVNVKNLDTNKYTVLFLKDKKISKEYSSFDYNGYKFYVESIKEIKENTFTFTASVENQGTYYLSDGTSNDMVNFPKEDAYKAEFNINYMNETLFKPTMTDVREFYDNLGD